MFCNSCFCEEIKPSTLLQTILFFGPDFPAQEFADFGFRQHVSEFDVLGRIVTGQAFPAKGEQVVSGDAFDVNLFQGRDNRVRLDAAGLFNGLLGRGLTERKGLPGGAFRNGISPAPVSPSDRCIAIPNEVKVSWPIWSFSG